MYQQCSSSEELRIFNKQTESGLSCWPKHADSPTSVSSQASFSSEDSEIHVKEAVGFMRKFLYEQKQDVPEKIRFLECVDLISTSMDNEKDGFRDENYNATLLRDILRFLSPEIASPKTEERELALSRITKIIGCIIKHCVTKEVSCLLDYNILQPIRHNQWMHWLEKLGHCSPPFLPQGMKDFKVGKLAGGLILCCSDPSDSVCCWAADGLHRLYTLILHQKSLIKAEDNQDYLDLLQEWEQEKIFWLAWFSDVSTATMIFKKCLRPEDQTDFTLMVLKAMRDDSVHSTKAAVHMLKAMLREPRPNFVKVPKIIRTMYSSLEFIIEVSARQEVFRFLRLIAHNNPRELVKTLLGCSIQCDSTATSMWSSLMSFSDQSQKVLAVLQDTLQQPFQLDRFGAKSIVIPLAATAALQEILRHPPPACRAVLKEMYPMLCIALLCQITSTVHIRPKEIDRYWKTCIQQNIPTPPVPARLILKTLKTLIRRVSFGDQALIMNKRRGSELLFHQATHQKGLTVFARALVRNESCEGMLPYIMKILNYKDDAVLITVMIFLVELLHQRAIDEAFEEDVIQHLCKQLRASRSELRSLALDGMLCLSTYPGKVFRFVPALPDILARLKEVNREINVKALRLIPRLLKALSSEKVNSVTLDVALRVLPLFDDASNKVRLAAISTFTSLFDHVQRGGQERMREIAIQSLVPLMVHLQDESVVVTQACWLALRRIDKFLKSFLQFPLRDNEPWRFCTSLVKRYQDQGENIFMDEAFPFLDSPREALREGAVKLLQIIAKETSNNQTVSAITAVLNVVSLEAKPSSICLVASEIIANMAHVTSSENLLERWFDRITKICRR